MDYDDERDWFMNNPLEAHDLHMAMQRRLDEATKLIGYLIDNEYECSFDHHGNCQDHHGGFMDGGCWNPRAKAWLEGAS